MCIFRAMIALDYIIFGVRWFWSKVVQVVRAIPMGQFYYGAAATMIYMMKAGDNMIKYVTGQAFKEGEEYTLQATIKAHVEYKGTKQTVITRAKLI